MSVFSIHGRRRNGLRRFLASKSVPALVIALIAIFAFADSPKAARARVLVVAVRDSGLFTMCPPETTIKKWGYPGRTPSLEIIQNPEGPRFALPQHLLKLDRPVLDRSRAGWWNIIGRMPGLCPSGTIDPDLKRGVEKEFSKRDDYLLVNSVEQADLVFLAEGLYADQYSGFIGAQFGRAKPTGLPLLGVVMAIVVPAGVYARDPADSELLLEGRLWEGVEAWKSNPPELDGRPASEPASLEQLVTRFINRKNPTEKFFPLCAPRILTPSVDGLGMPRSNSKQNDAEGRAPVLPKNVSNASTSNNAIKVNVSLVTVPTIVSDGDGRHVPDLSAKDFHVFENGVEQQIDRVIPEVTPFNVVLMLDTSGSTLFEHSQIQNAALAFVETLRAEDRIMVVSFDSYIYLDSAFTLDRAALRRAILRTDTGAGTRLYDALDLVLTECLSRVEGRKAIVLFTDGIDTESWLARLGNYQEKVEESDALVYVVQYDARLASFASKYLNGLSENSGGRLFIGSTITTLTGAFAGISDELQHQYTICYYPSSQVSDSAFRQIRVTVDRPGAKIRARAGYRIAARPTDH